MQQEKVNIAIIDKQQLFREGIKLLLERNNSFNILLSSGDYSIIKTFKSMRTINILLIDMDIFLKNKKLIKNDIIDVDPEIKVIILSTTEAENYVIDIITYGAHGYIPKEMDIPSFVKAIMVVLEGKYYIHAPYTHNLIVDYRKFLGFEEKKIQKPLHLITEREYEVLELLATGKSNAQISQLMNISEKTIKNHISNILKKMNVNSRTQAVVTAIQNNWIEMENRRNHIK